MTQVFRRPAICVAALIVLLSSASLASAQGMSFSVYTDAEANSAGVITMWADVVDNSWGCSHTAYSTTAYIRSPGGRVASSQSAGLNASTSLAIADEFGEYNIYSTGSYTCNCIHSTAGFGGGMRALAEDTTIVVAYGFVHQPHLAIEDLPVCEV